MFDRLVEDLIALEGIDPDRVYVLGYSAGGDGVYQLAPRLADHWAAAAMMAGHPNGVSLLSLRNVPFALQVGADDAAYKRNEVGREYGAKLDALEGADVGGYAHFVRIREGKPHWMGGEDREALPWMAAYRRNPVPDRVVWKQTGPVRERSYWLAVPEGEAKPDSLVVAKRDGQTIDVTEVEGVSSLLVRLDDRMVDLDRPVIIRRGEKVLFEGVAPRTIGNLIHTLTGRGDPGLVFDAEVGVGGL
jgi:pimeloyl-ACP methyl ester carboxylesterase